jgi:hypothetical protein
MAGLAARRTGCDETGVRGRRLIRGTPRPGADLHADPLPHQKRRRRTSAGHNGRKLCVSTDAHCCLLMISDLRRETADAISLAFAVPPSMVETFCYTTGQYLTLRATIAGEEVRRPYSICTAPAQHCASASSGCRAVHSPPGRTKRFSWGTPRRSCRLAAASDCRRPWGGGCELLARTVGAHGGVCADVPVTAENGTGRDRLRSGLT